MARAALGASLGGPGDPDAQGNEVSRHGAAPGGSRGGKRRGRQDCRSSAIVDSTVAERPRFPSSWDTLFRPRAWMGGWRARSWPPATVPQLGAGPGRSCTACSSTVCSGTVCSRGAYSGVPSWEYCCYCHAETHFL